MKKSTDDVALAIVRRDQQWLVAQRCVNAHLGGLWEFPGGKFHDGETPVHAAIRELREECGIAATPWRVLPPHECDYGDRIVRLVPVLCRWNGGEPQPLGNQQCRWVATAELHRLEMPDINTKIIAAALEACD